MTDRPILLVTEPRPSRAVTGSAKEWWWSSDPALAEADTILARGLSEVRASFPVLEPPPAMLEQGRFTRQEFTIPPGVIDRVLAPGVATIAGTGDLYHMNAEYGAVIAAAAVRSLHALVSARGSADRPNTQLVSVGGHTPAPD
jgi:hypothetical protein